MTDQQRAFPTTPMRVGGCPVCSIGVMTDEPRVSTPWPRDEVLHKRCAVSYARALQAEAARIEGAWDGD